MCKVIIGEYDAGGDKPGFPRFRGHGWYDSFTFKQFGIELLDHGLFLSKIGAVKIILHRPIEGKIKTLTIQRDVVGNWYACFACDVEPEPLPFNDLAIGIDMGLECFAKFSSGQGVDNPRFFRRDERELAKAQRKLSKAEPGTPERAKRRKAVQHIHQRIANRHRNFAHQESRKGENASNASYYYSQPRLRVDASIEVDGAKCPVSGLAWKDHEFSSSVLGENQIGWDWYSLQFENGAALMLFQLREREGGTSDSSSGMFIAPNAVSQPVRSTDFEITVLDQWHSPHSQGLYPAAWAITLNEPNCMLEVYPWMAGQELNFRTVAYREGGCAF